MQITPNYGFKKPEDNEIFDQQAHANANMDLIDTALAPMADPSQNPTGNGPGKLVQWVSWFANRIKSITGKPNWYDPPDTTLADVKAHMDAAAPHSGHAVLATNNQAVNLFKALNQQIDTRQVVLSYDANGRISTVQEKDGSTTVKTTTLNYDGNGRLSSVVEQVGGKTVTTTLSYDGNGNVTNASRTVT